MDRSGLRLAFCAALVGLACPPTARAQVGPNAEAEQTEPAIRDVRSVARSAQSSFERRRIRYLPVGPPIGSTMCDGTVGRFCWWAEDGEWYPTPEDERIVDMRAELITTLDSLQSLAPADDWILGQRVWYRAQAGRATDAYVVANACPTGTTWWCSALEGFSLHRAGRYADAERSFERALLRMEPEMRLRWTIPRWSVDSKTRDVLSSVEEVPELRSEILRTMWLFADPLFLVESNDRRTSHLARWVVAELRKDARNPFRISWGEDLTQLTVRNGWEIGWERSPAWDLTSPDDAIGRKHPEARDYMPGGEVLRWPVEGEERALRADRAHSRSLYAPAYAPVLLPMESQIAVFPRGPTTVFVATQRLPPDTTFHASHDHPRPWMEPGDAAGTPDRRGLFALPLEAAGARGEFTRASRREPFGVTVEGDADGALLLEVPSGTYLVSTESLREAGRQAGRWREVVRERRALEDLATLSDIILLDATSDGLPGRLEDAVGTLLPTRVIGVDQKFAIAWEVAGLGFRDESLRFEVSVEREGRNVFNRLGGFLGLSDGPRSMELSWEEPGPSEPGPSFHALELDIPDLEGGRYQIRLRLHTADRTPAESVVEVRVIDER